MKGGPIAARMERRMLELLIPKSVTPVRCAASELRAA
jgi:hypothetical protein